MSTVWNFLLIWGVWLITPVIVDGVETIGRLIVVKTHRRKRSEDRVVSDEELPSIAIVVPAHNEVEVIDRCITSIKAQDYPASKLEVVIVDDGSTDGTADRVEAHVDRSDDVPTGYLLRGEPIQVGPFHGTLALIKNGHAGKAHALNAGIEASTGEIVVNIDSDVVLSPLAIRHIGEYFARNEEIDAATGNIEVDWEMIEARDDEGNLILDEDGNLVPRELSPMQRFLAKSQFLEYLSSFDMGRRSQAITSTMYSLAGACSAFRRSVFEGGSVYSNDTVSEDTYLTFELHRKGSKIGYIEEARVHLEPVVDWDELYAQRVRWSRGQLEVCGANEDMVGGNDKGDFSRMAVPKMLLFDHTLAFPRLIWVPLIVCFPIIGYSWKILAIALVAMYLFYLALEVINTVAANSLADRSTRLRIEQSQLALLGLPVYRFIVFHFRFSGFLVTLTEKQQWTMRGPVQTMRDDSDRLKLRSVEMVAGMIGSFMFSALRVARAVATGIAPLLLPLFAFVLTALSWIRRDA